MKRFAAALAALALSATAAAAQVQIDKRRPASPAGQVTVGNNFGSVKVIGTETREVSVTGRLAAGAEGLSFDGDKESVSIDVETPERWSYGSEDDTEYRSDLEIRVPKGSSVEIQTLNASVAISGVDGTLSVETVNGAVTVSGNPRSVQVNGVTGRVDVSAVTAEMQIENVSGPVTLRGAARGAEVSTISGAIDVEGKDLARAELKSTSGDIRLHASLKAEGGVNIENFSGNVLIVVPADVAARFKLTTFSGMIENEMGPKPARNERRSPYMELRFTTALNDFDVEARTYTGNITLKRSGEAKAAATSKKEG